MKLLVAIYINYFTDTGLLRYLLRYPTPDILRAGPMGGHIFENFIISEILKWKFNHAVNAEIYFYRDSNGNEVDCVIDLGIRTVLLEIKMRASIVDGDEASLSKFPEKKKDTHAYLVSCWEHRKTIDRGIENVLWWMLGEMLGGMIK